MGLEAPNTCEDSDKHSFFSPKASINGKRREGASLDTGTIPEGRKFSLYAAGRSCQTAHSEQGSLQTSGEWLALSAVPGQE